MNFVTKRLSILFLCKLFQFLICEYAKLVFGQIIFKGRKHILSKESCLVHEGHGIDLYCYKLRFGAMAVFHELVAVINNQAIRRASDRTSK